MAHMRTSDWAMERNSVYYQFGRAQKLAILGLAAAPFSFIQNAHTHIQNTSNLNAADACRRVASTLQYRCLWLGKLQVWSTAHEYFTCNHIVFPLTFKIVLACGGNGRGRGIVGRIGRRSPVLAGRCHT